MEVITDYEGSSIDIIDNNKESNRLIISPKLENNFFSNYFNFKVENNSDKEGIIYIKNLNKLQYPKENTFSLFIRENGGVFKHIKSSKIKRIDEDYIIKIDPYQKIEISSYPRYVSYNLDSFLNEIKKDNEVKISNENIKKIVIGNKQLKTIVITGRQHPGETLSSFFIEGIVEYILLNKDILNEYCFLIFPMVNLKGVKDGNHRYTDNIDYNRMWNTNNKVEAIDYIKDEMKKYNITLFIDVHCDEITENDYIRTKINIIDSNMQVIKDYSKIKRFLRALIKQRKIINFNNKTAREYVSGEFNCDNMLIELSPFCNDEASSKEKGNQFLRKLK